MFENFPFFPRQASTMASQVDAIYFFLIAISVFFATLIFCLVTYFAIRYRRKSELEVPSPMIGSTKLELVWTIIPLIIVSFIFVWGTRIYFQMIRVPEDTLDLTVVGKQWMWKIQHPQGRREINTLHIPVGQPIKLLMTSEDVIHSFFVPAFRIKMDVLPGRYSTTWFEATQTGQYHLFCTEYCGTKHSQMVGSVYVMDPVEYQRWLSGATDEPLEISGQRLFEKLRCDTCHMDNDNGRGPSLRGLFGRQVSLSDGGTVEVDEAYVRESILNPQAKTVAGFTENMPTFQGQVSETGLLQIIAYLKSLDSSNKAGTQ